MHGYNILLYVCALSANNCSGKLIEQAIFYYVYIKSCSRKLNYSPFVKLIIGKSNRNERNNNNPSTLEL